MKSKLIFATTCALASAARVFAGTIDFEAAPVNQDAGSFYQGATFTGDIVTSSSSAFPGTGAHVLGATGSDIVVTFSTLQTTLSFNYSTYFTLVATAFDKNGNVITTFSGANNTDAINTGANGLGTLTSASAAIAKVDFAGVAQGFYTIDNLSGAGISGQPAPDTASTLALFGAAGVGLFALRRKLAVQ